MALQFLGSISPSQAELPLYLSLVPAGFPSPAQDHLDQKLSLDELLDIDAPHTYLVRCKGDSMIGAGIYSDDLLVVSRSITARSGDIVIASVNGEATVKRLVIKQGATILHPENPNYPPRYIIEGDELMIWGVVTNSIRRHVNHG